MSMTVLTRDTVDILQNFATINNSIVIKPGNTIGTLSVNKNILASADVPEEFDRQISIYDLGSFIAGTKFFDSPKLVTDNDNYVTITEQANTRKRAKFYYADPDIIVQPPDKNIQLPSVDVEFDLSGNDLKQLLAAAATYRVPDLCVYGDGESISLCITDKKNDTSNTYSVEVGETDKEFCYCFKVENLRVVNRNYTVSISNSNVAYFDGGNIRYWIALEP